MSLLLLFHPTGGAAPTGSIFTVQMRTPARVQQRRGTHSRARLRLPGAIAAVGAGGTGSVRTLSLGLRIGL